MELSNLIHESVELKAESERLLAKVELLIKQEEISGIDSLDKALLEVEVDNLNDRMMTLLMNLRDYGYEENEFDN